MKQTSDMPDRWRRAVSTSTASVRFYDPKQFHDSHEHEAAHVSIVLAGSFEERSGSEAVEVIAGSLRVRRAGFHHCVAFGSSGALVLALPAPLDDVTRSSCGADSGWLRLHRWRTCRDIVRTMFRAAACDVDSGAADLIALASPIRELRRPPVWLRAARERLIEAPAGASIQALAEEAGVHRVHFGRLFDAAFGTPPSIFRRRAMVGHATAAILQSDRPLAVAAAEAGFADQAHMSRAFMEFLGVTPAQLRASLQ